MEIEHLTVIDNGTRKFNQGSPHPIGRSFQGLRTVQVLMRDEAWYQEHGAGTDQTHLAGRSFYTSLGHLNETWQVGGSQ